MTGNDLRQLIRDLKLTHERFAAETGYTVAYISQLCGRNGGTIPAKAARYFEARFGKRAV